MAYESEESLKIYLREIAKTPLLTLEEEGALAARIANGDEAARTQMIEANLRLVVKIAQDYGNYGVPVPDLISEGNMGLMKAVERFDPKKGGKLSTYAAWWIKQSIKRALANQGKTIRLPVHMVDKIAKIRRITRLLTEALGHEPTVEELAEETGVSRHKLEMLLQASQGPTSLDAPINEGEATEYGEVIADEGAENPLDMLSNKNLHGELDDLLAVLDDRERRIIDVRFGLDGHQEMTLEEVGRELGVTRERIRQLQQSALTKMRKALRKKDKNLGLKPVQEKSRKKTTAKKTTASKKTPSSDTVPQSLVISDAVECDAWLAFLLNHGPTKTAIGKRGHVAEKIFWGNLRKIVFPQKDGRSAAEILQCILLYHFASGKGEDPGMISDKITAFLRARVA